MKPGLTAILLAFDEETNIDSCLRSIEGVASEIIVVDSGSTDRTLEICRRYTDKIVFHEFTTFSAQWLWALEELPIGHEWVLPLDADHVLDDVLRADVRAVISGAPGQVSGYFSRHQYIFWGVPMHGFKRYTLRIFRNGAASVDPGARVDCKFCVRGKTGLLKGTLREYDRKELSIDRWIDKHQKYSSHIAAEEVLRSLGEVRSYITPKLMGSPDERILWMKNLWFRMPLLVRPALYFLYRYILRGGIFDGSVGLTYHFMQALWYRTLIDIKVIAIRRELAAGRLSVTELRRGAGR